MEPITRETFNKWAQKNNWMQVGEGVTPQGRNYSFITPAGPLVIVLFDLKGNLMGVGQPALPPPPPSTQMPVRLDLKRPGGP